MRIQFTAINALFMACSLTFSGAMDQEHELARVNTKGVDINRIRSDFAKLARENAVDVSRLDRSQKFFDETSPASEPASLMVTVFRTEEGLKNAVKLVKYEPKLLNEWNCTGCDKTGGAVKYVCPAIPKCEGSLCGECAKGPLEEWLATLPTNDKVYVTYTTESWHDEN